MGSTKYSELPRWEVGEGPSLCDALQSRSLRESARVLRGMAPPPPPRELEVADDLLRPPEDLPPTPAPPTPLRLEELLLPETRSQCIFTPSLQRREKRKSGA